MHLPTTPGAILGYRKNGAPIRLQAGGDPTNDEPEGGNDPQGTPPGRVFTEDEVNRLLSRERDKLHGKIEKTDERFRTMQAELKDLQKEREERAKEEDRRRKEAEDATRRAEEAELSAKDLIERRQAEWQEQFAAQQTQWQEQITGLSSQLAERDAILHREREFAELRAYAQAQVAEARDEIAPELLDYIGGETKEQIDASIQTAKEKSAQIVASIQQAQVAQRAAMPGVSPAGFAPLGPIDAAGGQRALSPDEIKGLSNAEYAKLRMQPGMPGSVQQGRGLFG
jgi:hypothetical protein